MSLKKLIGLKETKELEDELISNKSDDVFAMMGNFWNIDKWNSYSLYEKTKNFFMVNRFMAINFPIQSAMMSRNGIVGGHIVEFWKRIFNKQFKGLPGWIYTRTQNNKKVVNTKYDFNKFDSETIDYFYSINNCSYKEFDECKSKFPKELFEELEDIQRRIKSYTNKGSKIK